MNRKAEISSCGQYRYTLDRSWGEGSHATFLMFNPSTADGMVDDHTIRKCIGFAQRWGHGSLTVINLFALRSTDPREVGKAGDPVGALNDEWIQKTLSTTNELICAWGCEDHMRSPQSRNRTREVMKLAEKELPFLDIYCLGTTKGGTPRHPLMLSYDAQRQEL